MTTTVTSYEIPLEANAQTFRIALAGVTYAITLWWNSQSGNWNISIADSNNIPILDSIPLVTGVDLLGPFGYLEFGGQLVVQTDHDPNAIPTFTNLGTTSHVYFVVTSTTVDANPTATNVYFGSDGGSSGGGGSGGRVTIMPVGRGPSSA